MDLFATIIIYTIVVTFPLTFCLLYQSYNQTLNKKKNTLYLDIALFSAFYLIIKFGFQLSLEEPLFLNIPLIIAYSKNRKNDGILLSICIILYYNVTGLSLLLLVIEYLIYFVIYYVWESKKKLVNVMLLAQCCFFLLRMSFGTNYDILYCILMIMTLTIITRFSLWLFERAEDILELHVKIRDFEQEKKIRESLFKITHEIKNPIAVCKGYLDMFDANKPEHSRKYVPILREEIARILVLLEDFLSINKIKIEKEIMDVNLLLENIYHNFIPMLENLGIETDFQIGEDELFMEGDYNRLSQVLINMIKNSIEAIQDSKNGKIKVYTQENRDTLKIIIEDNGRGMTKEELSKIKDPFFTTKEHGTGLGIYLSDEIIRKHNGDIKYISKEGKGTKVILKFPKNFNESNIM